MSTIKRLEEHAERLRARKKAALIWALFHYALLIATSLRPTLFVILADYQPDPFMVFTWFFLSVANVVLMTTRIAERRMLEQTLDLIEVLQETTAEDGSLD